MCVCFGYNPLIFFSHFFCFVNLVFFSVWNAIKVYRQWVPCGNSSYSFALIVLKHCRCFQHGMNLSCACGFGIILWLFFSLFLLCELSLFFTWNAIKVYRQWVPCLTVFLQLFWNFTDVFGMEWRCTCGLGITLFFPHFFCLKSEGYTGFALSFRHSVIPSFRHSFITFQMKLEYLGCQLASLDQIWYGASLSWGTGCIRFGDTLDQNSDFHGNRKRPLT